MNGDGFGLGWYGEHPEPGLYRETRPAWSNKNLRYLCRHLRSHLFFAHVRAATGTAVTRQNCHPFACGRWMFMHNGFVGSWNRLRRKVEQLIPDALLSVTARHHQSEAVFLAMLGAGSIAIRSGRPRACCAACATSSTRTGKRERMRFTTRDCQRPRSLRLPLRRERCGQHAVFPRKRGAKSSWSRNRSTRKTTGPKSPRATCWWRVRPSRRNSSASSDGFPGQNGGTPRNGQD